jgi:type IV pilus assembly protein PilA
VYTGSINNSNSGRRGFAIIDLLVVILVVAILMAVALPLYLNTVADTQKESCHTNMQIIANAVEATAVKQDATDYGDIITGGINKFNLPYLSAMPICPDGGKYSIVFGSTGDGNSFKVICSFPKHGSLEPGEEANKTNKVN